MVEIFDLDDRGEREATPRVNTVSINCEDFQESFLTCSTCLCEYFISIIFIDGKPRSVQQHSRTLSEAAPLLTHSLSFGEDSSHRCFYYRSPLLLPSS